MISYKYKLYRTNKTKILDRMLREACFVWNHALALQKRYYRLYSKYIGANRMQKHFAKRISRNLLHSQTVQEILQRLDTAYQRFFKRLAKRPPKFRKAKDFLCGLAMQEVTVNPLGKVGFHLTDADVFVIQAVVPLLQGQSMIPDKTSLTEHSVQNLRFIGTI